MSLHLSRSLVARLKTAAAVVGLIAVAGASPALADPAVGKTVRPAEGLYEIAFNGEKGLLYVASAGKRGADNGQILVLDAKTLETVSAFERKDDPAFGLGLNQKTQTLYTTNTRSGGVSIIDLATGATTTVTQGEKPHVREVQVDEAADKAYVTVFGGRDASVPGTVWVIDGATDKIEGEIADVGAGISGLVVDAAGGKLYLTSMFANEVITVDSKTRAVTNRFPSGGEAPINISLDAAGQRLFVANQKSGTITVLDAASGKQLASVATGEGTLDVEYNAGNGLIYVAARNASTVSVIDGKTYGVVATLKTGTYPQTIVVDAATRNVYISSKANNGPRDQPPVEDPNGDTVALITP